MLPKKQTIYIACVLFYCVFEAYGEDKSSLTFVIDDTYSMSDDINQVKLGANAIFDAVLKSNDSQVEDFILVTFNDPDTQLRTITKDRNVFKNALSAISVHGGGDCPEYSMSGIIQGIINSRSGSTIYVFTDAAASDYSKYDEAKNFAMKKLIQVVFVLTGVCGSKKSRDYLVYHNLAGDTGGQVFHLGKHDIRDILDYVVENVKGRRTTLINAKFPPGSNKLNFTVDDGTKDPTVSITGNRPKLNITGPDGSTADSKTLVHKPSLLIEKLLDPKPGNYTVDVSSDSDSHVVVSARTTVKFQHGFSTFKPSSIKETSIRPLPDVKSHITIQLTDGNVKPRTVQIVDMHDKLLKEVPLAVINEKDNLYVTELEDLPDIMFKIGITAYDPEHDKYITRVGNPISPQPKLPGKKQAPKVTISDAPTITAEWGKPLQLKCKITGYPQPDVVWMNTDTGNLLTGTVSTVEVDEFVSILNIDKPVTTTNYECKATNPSGTDSTTVKAEITKKPYLTVLRKPTDTSINYHNEGEIHCEVDAYPPPSITWYKDRRTLLKNDNLEFSANNSVIKIKEMNPSDDGSYMCEVRTSHMRKILTAKVTLTGVDAPEINKTTSSISIRPGTDAVITCHLTKGYPKPKISWFYDDGYSGELKSLEEWSNDETITIRDVKKNDAGSYSCLADNVIGNDFHEVELNVEYPPKIKRDVEDINVSEGKTVVMPCSVEGKPDPVVVWYKDDLPLTKSDNIYIFRDHNVRIKLSVKDSGTYTCNATNKFGTASRTVKVDVHVPITLTLPKDTKMDIKVGSTLNLPCQATGHPTPNTEWTYYSFNSSVPPKPLLKSHGSSPITLKNMQIGEDGYYTCTARNSYEQSNLTYEIHVLAPPLLDKIYLNKEFKAVEGDLVVMIKCTASGSPPPTIRWLKNGYWVAAGDDFTIENGTFIIKNISRDAEGVYVCEAKNSLGFDREAYEVKVDKTPLTGHPTSTVTISEGDSAAIRCDVPHKRTDLLRWYKNNVLIQTGELVIRKAQTSDSGLYTCRVSDFTKSSTGNTMVRVGFKPKFDRDEVQDIEYVESSPLVLSCDASGEPKPKYTWWHNGEVLNITDSFHYFEMEIGMQGQYTCDVSNEFGNIVRSFNVISKDCIIDIKRQPSKLQPLMVSSKLQWPQNIVKNGFMSIPKDKYVALFCPNRFKEFPKAHVVAFCEGATKFKVNGKTYDYSDIECTEKVTHFIERTGQSCFYGNTELVQVLFKVFSVTIESYDVCLDIDNNKPIYTRHRMSSSVSDVDYSSSEWSDSDEIDLNLDEAYECDRQIQLTSSTLGRWFHRDDGCCFAKRQLVNPKDLFPGVAQRSAYSELNVVPHWSTCNAKSNNWNEVEQRVRSLAKASYSELVVATGVAEDLTLADSYRSSQDIFITDKDNNVQAVPKYLWKVVQEPATKSSLVIIQVNVPDMMPSEAPAYVRCRDICNTTKWMKGTTWYDVHRGFTYCCSLKDFEDNFGYRGVFEPYNQVLSDVSLIPDYSLT